MSNVLGKKVNSDSVVVSHPGLPCLGENGANTELVPFYPSCAINRMTDTTGACSSNCRIILSYFSKMEEAPLESLAVLKSACGVVERQALSLSKVVTVDYRWHENFSIQCFIW